MGKKDKNAGAEAKKGAKQKMPDGSEKPLNNGSHGFFCFNVAYFRCQESLMGMLSAIELRDRESLGSARGGLPKNLNLSKAHITIANQNGYTFIKDGSKQGTYIKLKQGQKLEIFKGGMFAVGRVWFKVVDIEGAAPCNASAARAEAEAAAKDALQKAEKETSTESAKKVEALDSDEEYADSDDDGPKAGNYEGPATLVIASVDKKLACKGRFEDGGTIGRDKGKNHVAVPEDYKGRKDKTKKQAISDVHAKITKNAEGRFFLEDCGSSFGTYYGIGKKNWFQIADGDMILMAGVRCKVAIRPFTIMPQQGLVDKIIGAPSKQQYGVTISGTSDVEKRLEVAGTYRHQ